MARLVGCAIAMFVGAMPAAADPPKPTVAVLDVVPKEESIVGVAATMTTTLRSRGKQKSARFRGVGTGKTIAAAVLEADCVLGEPSCMAKIGGELAADHVVHGVISRRGRSRTIVLSLFEVATKQRVRSVTDTVASSVDVKKWARAVYERLVDTEFGDLVVVVNASRGEVWIDGQQAAILIDGKATIARLPLGTHQLGVRARGFKPIDVEVEVDGWTTQSILLDPEPPPPPPKK
jgi:hypothetical protein